MAPTGQAATQNPHRVHRFFTLITACLRCPETWRVMRCREQAATQRPQPVQRSG